MRVPKLIVALLMLLGMTSAAQSFMRRPPRTYNITLKSERRNVPVTIVVPGGGTSNHWRGDVILFLHEIGSNPSQYAVPMDLWAKHGFIVIAPNHEENDRATGSNQPAQALWNSRLADIKLVTSNLPQLAKALGSPKSEFGPREFGFPIPAEAPKVIIGHGFGAVVAAALHGESVAGIIAFFPTGGLQDLPTPIVEKPLLTITSTADSSTKWQDRLFAHKLAKGQAIAYVARGTDQNFGRIIGKNNAHIPPQDDQFSEALEICGLFMETYLGDPFASPREKGASVKLARFKPKYGTILRR
jgi:dienelactone hydrolase